MAKTVTLIHRRIGQYLRANNVRISLELFVNQDLDENQEPGFAFLPCSSDNGTPCTISGGMDGK